MSLEFGQIFVGSFGNIGEEKVKKNSAVEDAGAEVDEHRELKKFFKLKIADSSSIQIFI
jgi:hypothetical protein